MKRLEQLCLLALLLMLSVSCSRIVHADYELMDRGEITAINESTNSLSIHSFFKDSQTSWYISPLSCDGFSLVGGVGYAVRIGVGDTVSIYRHDKEFIASRYDIEDVKNINKALTSYYWQNIAENWLWFLLVFGIIGIWGSEILKQRRKKKTNNFVFFSCIVIGYIFCLITCNTGASLTPTHCGTITQITPTYVSIDNSYTTPYATLDDIATHQPVKVGQKISLYCYSPNRFPTGTQIFFSTHKLNEKGLDAVQTYPEIWLMTTALFFITIILSQVPFYFFNKFITKKNIVK